MLPGVFLSLIKPTMAHKTAFIAEPERPTIINNEPGEKRPLTGTTTNYHLARKPKKPNEDFAALLEPLISSTRRPTISKPDRLNSARNLGHHSEEESSVTGVQFHGCWFSRHVDNLLGRFDTLGCECESDNGVPAVGTVCTTVPNRPRFGNYLDAGLSAVWAHHNQRRSVRYHQIGRSKICMSLRYTSLSRTLGPGYESSPTAAGPAWLMKYHQIISPSTIKSRTVQLFVNMYIFPQILSQTADAEASLADRISSLHQLRYIHVVSSEIILRSAMTIPHACPPYLKMQLPKMEVQLNLNRGGCAANRMPVVC
ncbi:uncharacterized protein MYCFIDRAFT_179970 [Pseudocercospora fijiensis CIRAD86]|uniref:Uncharacterized protein n=1 Tax=Pseudocercospora fijiensis (strain CIRAD86) TaxID=383855 RepID=M3AIU9_PSEFD|nr:uncharacterized protein MYCFIDRAFT_179970 [Pseudocercospora fijiensis CIRAD86]EME77397.1 hypothetical protein MYCFIDRAFT_179970 [Pseudocercospora fijiensis CIRAD86]